MEFCACAAGGMLALLILCWSTGLCTRCAFFLPSAWWNACGIMEFFGVCWHSSCAWRIQPVILVLLRLLHVRWLCSSGWSSAMLFNLMSCILAGLLWIVLLGVFCSVWSVISDWLDVYLLLHSSGGMYFLYIPWSVIPCSLPFSLILWNYIFLLHISYCSSCNGMECTWVELCLYMPWFHAWLYYYYYSCAYNLLFWLQCSHIICSFLCSLCLWNSPVMSICNALLYWVPFLAFCGLL